MVTVIKDALFLHAEHTVVLLFRVSTPISALSGEEQYVICYINSHIFKAQHEDTSFCNIHIG